MDERLKKQRLHNLKEWRSRAANYNEPPLGHLIAHFFDVIHSVVSHGIRNEESIAYTLASFDAQRDLASRKDPLRDVPLHGFIHDMSEGLNTMIRAILEEEGRRSSPGRELEEAPPSAAPFLPDTTSRNENNRAHFSPHESKELDLTMPWIIEEHPPGPSTTAVKHESLFSEDDIEILEPIKVAAAAAGVAAASTTAATVEVAAAAVQSDRNDEPQLGLIKPESPSEEDDVGSLDLVEVSEADDIGEDPAAASATAATAAVMVSPEEAGPSGSICPHCKKTLKNKVALKTHVTKMHRGNDGKKKRRSSNLTGWPKVRKPAKSRPITNGPVPCGQCTRTFACEEGLARHLHVHERADCSVCGKSITVAKMNYHMRMNHKQVWRREKDAADAGDDVGIADEDASLDYECTTCRSEFDTMANLLVHLADTGHIQQEEGSTSGL